MSSSPSTSQANLAKFADSTSVDVAHVPANGKVAMMTGITGARKACAKALPLGNVSALFQPCDLNRAAVSDL